MKLLKWWVQLPFPLETFPQGLSPAHNASPTPYFAFDFSSNRSSGSVGVCDVNYCSRTYKIICILSAAKAIGACVATFSALVCRCNDRQSAWVFLGVFFLHRLPRKRDEYICMHSVQRLQHFRCLFCTPLFAPLMRNINISQMCVLSPLWLSLCQADNLFSN